MLNSWEESLFLNPDETRPIPLGNLIRKTELQGELYDTVAYGQQTVSYPRPFLFAMRPQKGHSHADSARLARMLCLYDNAGEHFQPGQDTASSPVTRHLARSKAVMFLFDPTQDPRFRAACRGRRGSAARRQHAGRLSRQETILNEAAARIRRHAGLLALGRLRPAAGRRPLQARRVEPPARHRGRRRALADPGERHRASTWTGSSTSRACCGGSCCTTAPRPSPPPRRSPRDVTYIAVSSLGPEIQHDPATGLPAVRPADIRPTWVTAPLLYCISQSASRLIPRFVKRSKPG